MGSMLRKSSRPKADFHPRQKPGPAVRLGHWESQNFVPSASHAPLVHSMRQTCGKQSGLAACVWLCPSNAVRAQSGVSGSAVYAATKPPMCQQNPWPLVHANVAQESRSVVTPGEKDPMHLFVSFARTLEQAVLDRVNGFFV
jgi:hypothetical protein